MSKHDHFEEDIYKSGVIDTMDKDGLFLKVQWQAYLDEDTGEWEFYAKILEAYDDYGNATKPEITNLAELVRDYIGDTIYDY